MQSNAPTVSPTLLVSPAGSTISDPSSQMCFLQRVKGLKPLLWRPSSPGALQFPLPGELPLLPKVRVPDPMKSPQTTGPASSPELVGNMHADTSTSPRLLSLLSPPLTPTPATPPLSDLPSLPVTLTRTPTPTPPESSTP